MTSVGESPVSNKKRTKSKTYCHEKLEKIKCKLNEAYFQVEDTSYKNMCDCGNTQREIIGQFKEKF